MDEDEAQRTIEAIIRASNRGKQVFKTINMLLV